MYKKRVKQRKGDRFNNISLQRITYPTLICNKAYHTRHITLLRATFINNQSSMKMKHITFKQQIYDTKFEALVTHMHRPMRLAGMTYL